MFCALTSTNLHLPNFCICISRTLFRLHKNYFLSEGTGGGKSGLNNVIHSVAESFGGCGMKRRPHTSKHLLIFPASGLHRGGRVTNLIPPGPTLGGVSNGSVCSSPWWFAFKNSYSCALHL